MLEDRKGNIWIGTDGGGLNLFNKKTGEFKVFQHDPKNPKGIKSNAVTSITEDKDGTIWLGYWAGGVDRLDLEKQEFIAYKHQKDFPNLSWANECAMHIYEDNKSNLWVATLYQLELLNKKTGNFTSYVIPGSGLDNIVCAIHEDNEGDLWIGTYLGLHFLDPATKERVRYVHDKEDTSSLSNDKIYTIFEDSKNRMWVGTSDGLNLFNKKEKRFQVFRTDDGLPSNAIYAILEDKEGYFWISTGNGICRYNPDTKESKTYTVSDGLQGNEFKQHAFLKLKTREMLFGGAKGFNMFDPEKIQKNPNVPPVVLTGFKIFNKSLPAGTPGTPFEKHISQSKELNLSYKESVLSFEFAALNYISPEKNEYAYILEPFEKEWNYTGHVNTATYTNLDPGTYTFRVKASNNDGTWNEKGTSLSLIITPPFWQTFWFRAFVLIGLAAILITIFKVRVRIIEKQKKVLEEEVVKRTQELSNANTELHQQKETLSQQTEKLTHQTLNLNTAYNEIKRQGEILEAVYNDTKDNIRAAQVIQNTILPSLSDIKQYLPEIFILNKPKDVVSGDFYWFHEKEDCFMVAAIDCTGHGVSGAFMSIIGHNLLNHVVDSTTTFVASDILNRLNDAVIKQLHQDDREKESNEGMVISLCIFDKKKTRVQFSGANSPLYIVRQGVLEQVKPDKSSIGKSVSRKKKEFTNHVIDLQKGDMFYMFSDGYADQTGGPEGDKFMYSQFRELLLKISGLDMKTQEDLLDSTLKNWQGETEQLDDVLVIGFKI